MPVMFQLKADTSASEADVVVEISAGERDDRSPAYALKPLGTLSMPRHQWTVLADALTRGMKRPDIITFI